MSALNSPLPAFPEASTVTPKTIIAVGAVLPAVATMAVLLRLYVRIAKTKSVGFDDYLILFALVWLLLVKNRADVQCIDLRQILTLSLGIMMIVGELAYLFNEKDFHSSTRSYRICGACSGSTDTSWRRSQGVHVCSE